MARELQAGLHLLDRQIVDADGRLAGKVDDLELTWPEGGAPYVTAILAGPGGLASRLGGRLGRLADWFARSLPTAGHEVPARIPFGLVADVGNDVRLSVGKQHLEVARMDEWVRDHLIGRIPGAWHAPE